VEGIMVWGLIRIAIFSSAFMVGLAVIGPGGSTAGPKSFNIPRLNGHVGDSLVVACQSGDVVLKHVEGKPSAVQLKCSQSKIVVVRDDREQKTSYYHLLGM
jgi:hypothetical protein